MPRIYNSIIDTIGTTPLVRLSKTARDYGAVAEVLLKLECFNPLGSVKDRIGAAMVEDAIRSGRIDPDTILIEPTSGNTGIALSFVAAAKGLRLIVVMPETMSLERRKLIKILGARLILTEASKGTKGAVDKALELAERIPNSVVLQQFSNPANPQVHRETTAEEIWRDTDGAVDVVVAGIGTGGTITGVGEVLKSRKPGVRMVAVEPTASAVLSGGKPGSHRIQGIGAGFVPEILNTEIYDEIVTVRESDASDIARSIIQKEGIPIGISSGAIAWAALQVARRPEFTGRQIVAIMPSGVERYLSTWLLEGIEDNSDSLADLVPEGSSHE